MKKKGKIDMVNEQHNRSGKTTQTYTRIEKILKMRIKALKKDIQWYDGNAGEFKQDYMFGHSDSSADQAHSDMEYCEKQSNKRNEELSTIEKLLEELYTNSKIKQMVRGIVRCNSPIKNEELEEKLAKYYNIFLR